MKYSFLLRTRIVFFCISIFALILIGKLFSVQVMSSGSYSERADRQYSTPSSDIFERGTIYFERKDSQLVSAATQITGFKVAINPSKITDKESVYGELSKITDRTALRDLNNLCQKGIFIKVGITGRKTGYTLTRHKPDKPDKNQK